MLMTRVLTAAVTLESASSSTSSPSEAEERWPDAKSELISSSDEPRGIPE